MKKQTWKSQKVNGEIVGYDLVANPDSKVGADEWGISIKKINARSGRDGKYHDYWVYSVFKRDSVNPYAAIPGTDLKNHQFYGSAATAKKYALSTFYMTLLANA